MPFCNVGGQGHGYVMGSWFAASFSGDPETWCSLLWFKGWYLEFFILFISTNTNVSLLVLNRTLDTPFKYFMGMIGIFSLAVCNEILAGYRRYREGLLARKPRGRTTLQDDLIRTLLYGTQMMIAYLLMLVAMLYESVLFITLLCGLMVGHFLTLRFACPGVVVGNGGATEPLWEETANYGADNGYLAQAGTGRTPCCGGS